MFQEFTLWFTGLPCSGKSTLADKIYHFLRQRNLPVKRLDGDIVRQQLNKNLGFTKKDREKNLKNVGQLACSFLQQKNIVIASFISPYQDLRRELRKKIPNFIEVFVNCPIEICEKRDVKGFYQKAREGKIKNFTGVSDPYEPPKNPEIELQTDIESIEESFQKIISYLKENKLI